MAGTNQSKDSNVSETTVTTLTTITASAFNPDTSAYLTLETTTFSTTTPLKTSTTNATVQGDQSQSTSIVLYVMIPVAVLIMLEIFIFIILLRRCYAKKNAGIGVNSRHDSDCEEDQHSIFAVENKAYTGFNLSETQSDDNIITGNPKTNTDGNDKIRAGEQGQMKIHPGYVKDIEESPSEAKETGEQKWRKGIDPGYQEVKIESQRVTKEMEEQKWRRRIDPGYQDVTIESSKETETGNSHHSRKTEFLNRSYLEAEGSPSFQPVSKVDLPYAHVGLSEEDDNYNRLSFKAQNSAVNKMQVEDEVENDTEYDHTSSVRKRQPIKDGINYSHVSVAFERPETILRNKEENNVMITRPNKLSKHNAFAKPHTSNTKGNYEKRKTSVGYHDNSFQQDLMSSIEAKRKSLYSEVFKDINDKRHVRTTRNGIEKPSDTSHEMKYEYSQVVKKSKPPHRDEVETTKPKAKDTHACFIIGDENDCDGRKRNQNNDFVEAEKRNLNGASREMKYEYSNVVKKTKLPSTNEVETADTQSKDSHACFVISDKNDHGESKKNEKHDYINIVKK